MLAKRVEGAEVEQSRRDGCGVDVGIHVLALAVGPADGEVGYDGRMLLWLSACTPTCPAPADIPVEGDGDQVRAVRDLFASFQAQTGFSVCIDDVRLGSASQLDGRRLTIDGDHPREGALYAACHQLAVARDVTAGDPWWDDAAAVPPGTRNVQAELFARACEREPVYPEASVYGLAATCGDPLEPHHRTLLDALGGPELLLPSFPHTYEPLVTIEAPWPADHLFTDDELIVVSQISESDYDGRLSVYDLDGGALLWQEDLGPSAYDVELHGLVDGAVAVLQPEGRVFRIGRTGLEELAPAVPYGTADLANDGTNWWVADYDDDYAIRAYDPILGVGDSTGQRGEIASSTDGVWLGNIVGYRKLQDGQEITFARLYLSGFSDGRIHAYTAFGTAWMWFSRSTEPHSPWMIETLACEDPQDFPYHSGHRSYRVGTTSTETGRRFEVKRRSE